MYSENNRHTAVRRANDDFLRRMIGGEIDGERRSGAYSNSNGYSDSRSGSCCDSGRSDSRSGSCCDSRRSDSRSGSCCNSARSDSRPDSRSGSCCNSARSASYADRSVTPRLEQEQSPSCNDGDNGSCQLCPTHVHAPSLAMVYCPQQCWRNLLDPTSALSEGTLFAELVLPLEVGHDSKTKEVCNRRCNL